jgi:hypothetical protein
METLTKGIWKFLRCEFGSSFSKESIFPIEVSFDDGFTESLFPIPSTFCSALIDSPTLTSPHLIRGAALLCSFGTEKVSTLAALA